jgi:hypothetical protein
VSDALVIELTAAAWTASTRASPPRPTILLPQDVAAREAARAQDGLYVLTTSAPDGSRRSRVIGS